MTQSFSIRALQTLVDNQSAIELAAFQRQAINFLVFHPKNILFSLIDKFKEKKFIL